MGRTSRSGGQANNRGGNVKSKVRMIVALLFIVMLALAATATAFGGGTGGGKPKCNSGNGNGSETTPATDCDPGNSGGHNNGGD